MPWYVLATMALHEPVMTTPYHWPRIWHGTFLAPCPVMEQWYGLVLLIYLNDCGRSITGSVNAMLHPVVLPLPEPMMATMALHEPVMDLTISLTHDMAWHLLGTMPCHGAVIWAGVTDVYNWMIVVDPSLVQLMPCFTRLSCHYLNQWWQCTVTDPGYPGSGIWCCYHWFR